MTELDKAKYIPQLYAAHQRIEELNSEVCEEDGEHKMTPKAIAYLLLIALTLRNFDELGEFVGDPAIGIENNGGANLAFRKAGRRYSIIIQPDATFDLYSVDTASNKEVIHERLDCFDIGRIYHGFEMLFADLACPQVEAIEDEPWVEMDLRWAAFDDAQPWANKNVIPFPARTRKKPALAA
ncbi:hypothetical protein DYH09_04400 [bacterium CPR1]|nr:hypothetical protein [bacterium CPR1]